MASRYLVFALIKLVVFIWHVFTRKIFMIFFVETSLVHMLCHHWYICFDIRALSKRHNLQYSVKKFGCIYFYIAVSV